MIRNTGRSSRNCRPNAVIGGDRTAFTLVELLVVISIVTLLLAILVPSLSTARQQARGIKCRAHLHGLGNALTIYSVENRDVFVPGRMPKVDNCNWVSQIAGGLKYRPTFLAMMSAKIGIPPFDDPKACGNEIDRHGNRGDQQDYVSPVYVCPQVSKWTDERNGSYGYNYQFLGNSRLRDSSDIHSFKNWPVIVTRVKVPSDTVAVADSMGTAASYPPNARHEYQGKSRDADRYGNEGFNLDPPRVDPLDGEMAGLEEAHRTAIHARHRGVGNVLWVDGHADVRTEAQLGYVNNPDGSIGFEGRNFLWTGKRTDEPWIDETHRR